MLKQKRKLTVELDYCSDLCSYFSEFGFFMPHCNYFDDYREIVDYRAEDGYFPKFCQLERIE